MKMIDRTTYRQDEKLKPKTPRTVEFITDTGIRFTITRHVDYQNTWLLNCFEAGLKHVDLETDSFEDAKERGFQKLRNYLTDLAVKYSETVEELSIRPIEVEE